jgi:predicted Rossmann-fold nucleotide-binding protein
VIPELIVSRKFAHSGLPNLRVIASMHERKATMMELADAFVLMPGGSGENQPPNGDG